ncbi:UNVERIFIED_CONTAM: hypothetical protein Slati_4210200 [Sesamum latifolium]|uniref:Uncharacterized protein n=1 Tax=Sesamum latifolium TaxID=2727402 RepID=A0AAW2TAI1_9LAMI
MAHLFFKHIIKYGGMPKDIISDWDSHFIGVSWIELFKILGSKLSMSSSYHPQSDGQTECFNSMLEEYLCHFVRGTQKDWVKLLDVAQLCFNAQKSSSTNKSAFKIVTRQQPLLPIPSTPHKKLRGESSEADEEVCRSKPPLHRVQCGRPSDGEDSRPEIIELIKGERSSIDAEICRSFTYHQAYWNDSLRNRVSFLVENPQRLPCEPTKEIFSRQEGRRNQHSLPQLELTKTKEKVAKAILNHRIMSTAKRNHIEYLVKWKECSSKENTWERVMNLKVFLPLIEVYHASHPPTMSPSQVRKNVKGFLRTWNL